MHKFRNDLFQCDGVGSRSFFGIYDLGIQLCVKGVTLTIF